LAAFPRQASSLHKGGVEASSEGRLWAFFSSQFSLEWHMAAVVFLLIGGQVPTSLSQLLN
jgi:hypothetical protein